MFDIVSEYLELWVSPSSEELKFEFRRILKMNSEFPIGPEKTHGNEYLNFDFRQVPKMNSEFPDVPEKNTRKPRAPQLMHIMV